MRKLSLSQSGVNISEIAAYVDFLICAEENEKGISYSDSEYLARFHEYVKIMNNKDL